MKRGSRLRKGGRAYRSGYEEGRLATVMGMMKCEGGMLGEVVAAEHREHSTTGRWHSTFRSTQRGTHVLVNLGDDVEPPRPGTRALAVLLAEEGGAAE